MFPLDSSQRYETWSQQALPTCAFLSRLVELRTVHRLSQPGIRLRRHELLQWEQRYQDVFQLLQQRERSKPTTQTKRFVGLHFKIFTHFSFFFLPAGVSVFPEWTHQFTHAVYYRLCLFTTMMLCITCLTTLHLIGWMACLISGLVVCAGLGSVILLMGGRRKKPQQMTADAHEASETTRLVQQDETSAYSSCKLFLVS